MTRSAASQARWALPVPLLAFVAGWLALMGLHLSTNASDVPLYFTYGQAMAHGHVPYRDFGVEYPPGALVAFVLPALFASGHRWYRVAFELELLVCGVGILVASAATLRTLGRRADGPLAFMVAGILALGPIALGHFDLLPALLLSAAIAAVVGSRSSLSAILFGLAIATKLYALVALPLAVAWLWRTHGRRAATRWLCVAVGVILLCFLPFVALSPGGVWSSLSGQANRPLQLESSAAAVLVAAHQLVGLDVGVEFSHTSVNLGGTTASAAAVASVLAELAALLALWIAFARRVRTREELVRSAVAAVLVFVTLGKVFSPQFLIWLIPLIPLLDGALMLTACTALAAAVALTRAYFPRRWVDVIQLESLPTWFLVARDAVLVGLLVWLLRTILTRPPSPRDA